MPEYRRSDQPGGVFFFTLVTNEREPLFSKPQHIHHLQQAIEQVQADHPFQIWASVILPDHIHFLWELPEGDGNFSLRIARMKILFTQGMLRKHRTEMSLSKIKHRESGYWQRRFWEHTIRDGDDFQRHFDYIHYNPIKHGRARCPHDWPYSSFHRWVRDGEYNQSWHCVCDGNEVVAPNFESIVNTVGE